jgi:hypothetical protein
MTNPLPQEGPERELLVTALSVFSDDCAAPELTPDCPFFVQSPNGPSCAEECKDVLGKVQAETFTSPAYRLDGMDLHRVRRRSPRPRRGPAGTDRPFDAREQFLIDRERPLDARTVPSLVHELMTVLPFRTNPERWQRRIDELLTELGRRGIDSEALLRAGLRDGVVMSVSFGALLAASEDDGEITFDENITEWGHLLRASLAYDKENDLEVLATIDTLRARMRAVTSVLGPPELRAAAGEEAPEDSEEAMELLIHALGGGFAMRVEQWAEGAALGELLDLTPPSPDRFFEPLAASLTSERHLTGVWLADRFTKSYLAEWETDSLRREWDWHMGRREGCAPPPLMKHRPSEGVAISAELADRSCRELHEHPAERDQGGSYHEFVSRAAEALTEGRYDEAITTWQVLQRLNPGHAELNNNLGFCMISRDPQTALTWLERAKRLHSRLDGTNLANIVFVHSLLGHDAQVLTLAEKYQHDAHLGEGAAFLWRGGLDDLTLSVDEVPRVYVAELALAAAERSGDPAVIERWRRRVSRWSESAAADSIG